MKQLIAIVLVVAGVACGSRESNRQSVHASKATMPLPSASSRQVEFLDGHSREEAIRLLDQSFGDRAQHTEEDLRIIAVVERHMESARTHFPQSRKYLVDKKGERWIVTVLDLESLLRGGRDSELTFRVGMRGGQLSVLKE
jgi:hypothetical protein